MKDEHIWSKKPETILDWFCVVGACIAFYLILNNLGYFLGKIGFFIGILSPFAGGVVIAYILDPMVKFFYIRLFKEKKGTRGFAEAIITRGGLSVKEVNPSTLMIKKLPGLFAAGEMLDVDALTGGFNLQIAFSTGALAGQCAAEWAQEQG